MSIDEEYEVIFDSNMFDVEYYKEMYNIDNDTDAIYHYLLLGSDKGFNPSDEFDTNYYLEENIDVKNAGINPFVHYILWGHDEGRLGKLKDFNNIKNDVIHTKLNLRGKNGFIFPIESNSELFQHYDDDFLKDFDFNSFSKELGIKKDLFKKNKIDYNFLVIPDKSIVCKEKLPFVHENPIRLVDKLDVYDFSEYLDETHYSNSNNFLNLDGGKLLFSKIISLIDDNLDEQKLDDLINHYKLEVYKSNFSTNDDNIDLDSFIQKPLYLKEKFVSEYDFRESNNETNYYYNPNSYSDLRVLIFYNSNINNLKYFLPFYFKEVFLFYDYGALNRDVIKWFSPDLILELREENFIPFYNNPSWINNSFDFLKNFNFSVPKIDFNDNLNAIEKDISIIIPVYNVEKYLEECLESVINQTLENIEIICINDGSTDNCLDILKRYAKLDNRIIIINTVNHGLGAARNFGLRQARGKYIFFIDSDDWIDENALELLHSKAVESDLDMTFYQLINFVDEDGSLINDITFDHICFQHDNLDEKPFFTFEDVNDYLFEIPVCACSKLYKKSFLDGIDFKFPEGVYYEDNEKFYYSFLKSNKVGFVKEYLLFRRIHRDSITGQFREKQIDVIEVMNKVISVFIMDNKYELFKKRLINHTFANVIAIFSTAPLSYKQTFFDRIKKEFIGFNELKHDFEDNLSEEFKLIFELFNKNDFYIPFNSEYKLSISKYRIFNGDQFIKLDSKEYVEFKKTEEEKHYKICVVIPIYNNGNLTHRTFMSIENQSFNFEDIEILLINDNSSDNTFDLINDYAKSYPNVKAIHMDESSGSSGNPRNVGIKECSADYIIFLDHDDFFDIDGLEKLYTKIKVTESDVVFGTYSNVQNNQVSIMLAPHEKHGHFDNLNDNERLIAIPAPSIWTKLFKTSFIKKYDILFPTILGEDAIFMMDVLLNAKGIDYLWQDNICYHDLRSTSTTNNISLNYMQELFVSELYMYKRFEILNKPIYSIYRGINIIDFALNQLLDSDLTPIEINILFDLMKEFMSYHYKLGSRPKSLKNNLLYKIILSGDSESLINCLNLYDTMEKIESDIFSLEQQNIDLTNKNMKLEQNLLILNKTLDEGFNNSFNSNPLISIIIPVFNKEKYVEECIQSIFKQSYTNFEVICIDDCSTDNSLSILQRLSDKYHNIRIIKNEINLGTGKSRNICINQAKGDYILFIDADDFIVDTNSLKDFVSCAMKYNAPMVTANLDYLMGDGEILVENSYLRHISEFNIKKPEEYGIPWYFTRNMYDINFLKNNNIFFPESTFGEDPVFLSNVLLNIDFYIEIPISYYRYRASDVSKITDFEKYFEDMKNILDIFKLLVPFKKFENTLDHFSNVFINNLYLENHIKNENDFYKLKKLCDDFLEILRSNNYEYLYQKVNEHIEKSFNNINL